MSYLRFILPLFWHTGPWCYNSADTLPFPFINIIKDTIVPGNSSIARQADLQIPYLTTHCLKSWIEQELFRLSEIFDTSYYTVSRISVD